MASTFEIATRAALEEILHKHAQESKFGLIITNDSTRALIDDLYILLQTSRNLKGAGDRIMRQAAPQPVSQGPKRPLRTP